MLVDTLLPKASIPALAALGITTTMAGDDPTIDTIVMTKLDNGYACSQTLQLKEDETPSIDSLDMVRCEGLSQTTGVRILVL